MPISPDFPRFPGHDFPAGFPARGTDRRQPGALRWREQDVLMVLVEAPSSDAVFAQILAAGELGEPNQGGIFVEAVCRGHPMMPFDV
jgi:hypothetical protein